jgi:acetyl esterase/lipase
MKKRIKIIAREPAALLAADIIYSQKKEWCGGKYRQLKCSLLKPRCHYSYDENVIYPLIVWLCGGSFAEVDRNLWMPEMTYFAKHGWAVLSVDYSTTQLTYYPEQLEDVKAAIRYARAHAADFHIDPERVAIMGESAGGYLSVLTGCTNGVPEYEAGNYLDKSSTVQAIVAWYPVATPATLSKKNWQETHFPRYVADYPNLPDLSYSDVPPTMILHGTGDTLVPCSDGEDLYEALQKAGVDSELYLIEGANHADHHFVQDETKALILAFLNRRLGQKAEIEEKSRATTSYSR